MKSILELELELANAKLAKMTSTVKQLGTKLKNANEEKESLHNELFYYEREYKKLKEIETAVRKAILTKEESHSQALCSFEFNVTHKD